MKQIILENQKRIRAIIRRLTGANNEDIEQEVYLKAWQNLERYQEQGKFAQWIGMLTTNICRDYFRSRQYRQNATQIGDEKAMEACAEEVSPEEIIDAKTRQKVILKAVDSLPKKMRQVVIWFEFEEMSYEKIAQKTGEPVGTIKSRLFNARKVLAEKLQFLKGEK